MGRAEKGPSAEEAKRQRTRESIVLSNEAVDAFDHGDLDKAASLVTKATRLDPGNHNAWFNLGIVLDNQKKYQQASEAFSQALKINTDIAMYHYKFGRTSWFAKPDKDNSRSQPALESAVKLDPTLYNAHYVLGLIYDEQSFPKKAAQSWTKTVQLNPRMGKAYINLGMLYIRWRKSDQAIAVLNHGRKVVGDTEDLGSIYYNLGLAYEIQDSWTSAVAAYSKSLELTPDDLDALRQRGFSYAEIGDTKRAKSDLQQVLAANPSSSIVFVEAIENRLARLDSEPSRSDSKSFPPTKLSDSNSALPEVSEFDLPAMIGDAHRAGELVIQGERYLNTEIKVQAKIVWIYDCAKALAKPGLSRRKLQTILRDHPERCLMPHFKLADKRGAHESQRIEVVEIPRKLRSDELRNMPKEVIENWPIVPILKLGQEVIITGTWALRSPRGFSNSEGLLVYKSIEYIK